MNYEIIYKAANSYEAHFIKGLLKKYSIESKLLGENLSIGIGELPVDVLQVDILVPKDQIEKSRNIISDYENNLFKSGDYVIKAGEIIIHKIFGLIY